MKQVHSFLLGGLSTVLIIACSGSSGSGSKTSQPTKLDSSQVSQIVSAIKGKGAKWEYRGGYMANLAELGKDGWEVVGFDNPSGKQRQFFLKKRVD
mgnify:CR=1 FL=1